MEYIKMWEEQGLLEDVPRNEANEIDLAAVRAQCWKLGQRKRNPDGTITIASEGAREICDRIVRKHHSYPFLLNSLCMLLKFCCLDQFTFHKSKEELPFVCV